MMQLIERVLRKVRERRFLWACRAVLDTPPCRTEPDGVFLLSMIGTKVLLPYLVAAKSLRAALGRGQFVILDDGTLTAADRAVLAHHLDNPRIVAISTVNTGPCPQGGTWERLLTILDLRANAYVIQFDSDTLALGPLPDVAEAIASQRSFTLKGEASAEILPPAKVTERSKRVDGHDHRHVQSAIERKLDQVKIEGRPHLAYVRGCSGFAGFAPSGDGRTLAEAFSIEAARLLGSTHWAEWGSEQVTSNFVIANEPQAVLLPYDRYLNYWNEPVNEDARFIHFIGTFRYHGGAYRHAARTAIAALKRASAP